MLKRFVLVLALFSVLVAGCSSSGNGSGGKAPVDITPGAEVAAIVIMDSSCRFCHDITSVVTDLKENGGVKFKEVSAVDYAAGDASDLISKYNIHSIPALLLSKEIDSYPQHAAELDANNLTPVSGYYVLTSPPINRDTETRAIRGLVNVTLITDASCPECFDVRLMRVLVERQGVSIVAERTIDISSPSGKIMVSYYNITQVPTILLTGDLLAYPAFVRSWVQQVGTVDPDNTLIFRNMAALGKNIAYKDLSSGKIIDST